MPVEFWDLNADLLTAEKSELRMEVVSRNGADFKPVTQAETFAAVAALEGSTTRW